jgi:hypothetical protein
MEFHKTDGGHRLGMEWFSRKRGDDMLASEQLEELICLVSALDREALLHHFANFPAHFPIDFTPAFLESQPLDQIRHIFLALCLQCQKFPATEQESVAA